MFIKETLYRLKQNYGQFVSVYTITSNVNRETGDIQKILSKQSIIAVVLDNALKIKSLLALTGISQEVGTYKGNIATETKTRKFLISESIESANYIVYNKQKYNIKTIDIFENEAYIVEATLVENEPVNEIYTCAIRQYFKISESI